MNNKILYASMTGHSKKIARAIAEELNLPALNLADNPQIGECDILFIVSGIYGGEVKAELLEYAKTLSPEKVKKVVLLTSSTRNAVQGSLRKILVESGLSVYEEEYICQGSFLIAAMGHPNRSEVQGAVEFCRRFL